MTPGASNPVISTAERPGHVTARSGPEKSCDAWFADEVMPHERALRAYLGRRFPTLTEVDDVVQESFLRTFLAWQKDKLTSTRGFLFTAASNLSVSLFRQRKFIADTPAGEAPPVTRIEDATDIVEAVCRRDEIALFADAIANLPTRCREVVALRVLRGAKSAEIAAQLDISEQTVRVQLARGIKKCGEFLRERGVGKEASS
jgi:RNA polymerase sigma-70 factor (ECF subfamily)